MLDRLARTRASRAVATAQSIVSSHGPHPNYDREYRPQERSYWTHLPGWIWHDQRPAESCLDIGAGYGTLMVFCRLATGATVHGLDFDPIYMTDGLRAIEGIKWAQSNVELDAIPWPGPFDFIVFSEVLEHLNFQAVPTLQKIASVLRPGGRIYLSTPDAAEWGTTTAYYESYSELPEPSEHWGFNLIDDHIWQFSESELLQILKEGGLTVERQAYSPGHANERHFNFTLTVV